MAATFNFHSDISQTTWLPVKFVTEAEQAVTKYIPLVFENNVKFYINKCLENYKDISFNKRTGLFLTTLTNTSNILKDNPTPSVLEPLTEIFTPIATPAGDYDKIVTICTTPGSDYLSLSATTRASYNNAGKVPDFSTADCFKFIFSKDPTHAYSDAEENFVSIETQEFTSNYDGIPDKFLLTWEPSAENSSVFILKFKPRIHPESYSQKFSYLLSEDGISLFLPNSNFYNVLRLNQTTNTYSLCAINFTGSTPMPADCFLRFVSYKIPAEHKDSLVDSHLTKYNVSKLDFQQELIPDIEINFHPYIQNFLGIFPFENPSLKEDHAEYNLQITGLKNYQTPEYNYSFNSAFLNNQKGIHRVYDQIFSGTNQADGLDNIYLGYQAGTTEMLFNNNTETPFCIPATSPRVPLSAAGFIEDGAIGGHHPFVSDRIYVRQLDYSSLIPELPQPPSIKLQSNTWFCSWLSGSCHGEKIWMDRFYNAAYYTAEQALSAQTLVYNNKLDSELGLNYIYDVPSTLILEPGALYKFYHNGIESSKQYLKFLDKGYDKNTNTKVLDISSWSSAPFLDNSGHDLNALVYTKEFEGFNEDYWELDGTNHAVLPARSLLLEQNQFTTSIWVHSKDWSNVNGHQIFGNYYDSGYGLINDDAITAPLFSFINTTYQNTLSGQIFHLNYRFKNSNKPSESYAGTPSLIPDIGKASNVMIQRLPDFSYWVFSSDGYGYKYDPEGKLLKTTPKYKSIKQVTIDESLNLYLFQPTARKVSVLDFNGVWLEDIPLTSEKIQRIEVFKHKTLGNRKSLIEIIPIYGNASVIDNSGNIWQSLGNNLYRAGYNKETDTHGNSVVYATLGPTQQITCDSSNCVWVLHDQDRITKFNQDKKKTFNTFRIGKRHRQGLPENPCDRKDFRFRYINFLKTPESSTIGCQYYQFKDLAVLIDTIDNEIIMLDVNGDMLTRVDISTLYGLENANFKIVADGDFTGFQLLRKIKLSTKDISWKLKIANANHLNPENVSLSYDKSSLSPGWHHFVLVFDAKNKYAKFYLDSVLVDEAAIDINKRLFFDYRSSLLIGADSIKNTTLNDIVNIPDAYKFVGKVADLKIYNKALNIGEVEQVYFSSKFSDYRAPLRWNMTTGNRNYIEEIKHWFKLQLPGSKSNYFNINIHNLPLSEELKPFVEEAIHNNISRLAPAHTKLYKINWI